MFRKITVLAAALATTATLAVAAVPADAARYMDSSGEDTTYTYEPAGTHTMSHERPSSYVSGTDDDYCEGQTDAANSWVRAAGQAWVNGDYEAQERAQRNADAIAGEANAQGCVIYD